MRDDTIKKVLKSFGAVILVAALGSVFVFLGMDRFESMVKPSQWINSVIIPIVWTVIYSITGIVLFKWSDDGIPKNIAVLFIINGVLNVAWCFLFFTLHLTFVGVIAIILNLAAGVLLSAGIKKSEPRYFYALLIYPIWLCIATSLNIAIWILN